MSWGNTVPMRPLTTPKPFNEWLVATVAYVLGWVVTFVLSFVIGTLGFFVMTGMALTGEPGDPTRDDITRTALAVALTIGAIGLAAESWFIHRRGGARPVVAPLGARGASLLVGLAVTPLALEGSLVTALGIAVEVVLLALLIKPRQRLR